MKNTIGSFFEWSLRGTFVITLVLAGTITVSAAELPKAAYLPLDMAQKAANAALSKCIADGFGSAWRSLRDLAQPRY